MNKITPEKVKELRERTGVGMGKCKEALEQAQGDMEQAIDLLRKAGMASAVKKEGRETKEGMIAYAETAEGIALVEINAETDFVVQNEKFKQFAQQVAQHIAKKRPATLEKLLSEPSPVDPTLTVDQYRALVMQSLGENIRIKRIEFLPQGADSSFGLYSHMGGKIVAVVQLQGKAESLAREIAMHVAAEAPDYLQPDDVPAKVRAREEEIARGQITGKPPQIVQKIVEGKIKAFYDQVCLVCQKFIKEPSITIADLLVREGKNGGRPLSIQRFVRWNVGA